MRTNSVHKQEQAITPYSPSNAVAAQVNRFGAQGRGRGALSNQSGRYEDVQRQVDPAAFEGAEATDLQADNQTHVTFEAGKSIISTNNSPDIPFTQSINAYRGCEHGCVYCFARQSHAYMGLSAGLDFERQLFVKKNAAELLEQALSKPGYKMQPIAMGTNTDPYQPIEKEYEITRALLQVLNRFNHPCTIVTKSRMIVRDLDILSEMAAKGLVKVYVSVTTLDPKLARVMEPRASTPQRRLDAIRLLSDAGVPVGAMVAPVIPAINDSEMEQLLQAVYHAGARQAAYVLLRLPREVAGLFEEWLETHFPDRKDRVLSRLKAMRGGAVNDPRFKHRMKGTGLEAELLRKRFQLQCRRIGLNVDERQLEPLTTKMLEGGEQAKKSKPRSGVLSSRTSYHAKSMGKTKFTVPADAVGKKDHDSGQLNLFA